jgi:hypothetical protein
VRPPGAADAGPETPQGFARAGPAAGHQAVGQHHGVHRARAGAADGVEFDTFFFEQSIQHAPGEGAVGTASLQRQIDASDASPAHASQSTG